MTGSQVIGIQQVPEFVSRPVDSGVAYILLWLSSNCNGPDKINGNAALKNHLATLTLEKDTLQSLLLLARKQSQEDLISVCGLLQEQLDKEEKAYLLQMAVSVVNFNKRLSNRANHILCFLADLLALGQQYLSEIYLRETERKLPDIDDLSSISYWASKEKRRRNIGDNSDIVSIREHSLKILGLEESASAIEIKRAYRRLVQLYHPDRQKTNDKDVLEKAEENFLRVQKAYEVLR